MTTSRPPGLRHDGASARSFSRLAELVVQGDAQGLKGSRGRILVALAPADGVGDELGQGTGRGQVFAAARLDDGAGDLAGKAFLAKIPQDPLDLVFVRSAQEIRRGFTLRLVHTHVQRSVVAERKSALGTVELHGGDPQVEQTTIHLGDAHALQGGEKLPETRVREGHPAAKRCQTGACPFDGLEIPVDTHKPTIRRRALQDRGGVPTEPDRGVAVDATGTRRKHRHGLFQKHGRVAGVLSDLGDHR